MAIKKSFHSAKEKVGKKTREFMNACVCMYICVCIRTYTIQKDKETSFFIRYLHAGHENELLYFMTLFVLSMSGWKILVFFVPYGSYLFSYIIHVYAVKGKLYTYTYICFRFFLEKFVILSSPLSFLSKIINLKIGNSFDQKQCI